MSYLKTTWKNIRRSPYQALAAILIMTLTFLTISFFTFLLVGSTKIVNYFESKPQVTAFFKNGTKQDDINQLENKLQSTGKIASIKFVSQDEALKIYQQQNKNDPLLLDLVTADVLPSSFEISTVKIEDMGTISNMLTKSSIVSDVIYQKDVVSTLTSWTSAIRKLGIALIVLLSLVSIFIMATIIGIKISQKKRRHRDYETYRRDKLVYSLAVFNRRGCLWSSRGGRRMGGRDGYIIVCNAIFGVISKGDSGASGF